jgi:hypothetical protein
MTDFSVYLVSIGSDEYQLFIKNNCSDTDFARIIIGCSYMSSGKRVASVLSSFIVSPLQPTSEKVFLRQINRRQFVCKRIWVAFEPVKRRSRVKNNDKHYFLIVLHSTGRWRKTIGSETHASQLSTRHSDNQLTILFNNQLE